MLTHAWALLFIFGLASTQEQLSTSQTTNKIPNGVENGNQKSIATQPQFNSLITQNTQPAFNPNLTPFPQNIIPQTQFNPLAFQNPQLGNPVQPFLQPLANQGFFNPQLGALSSNPLNNGGFQGFNPQLIPNQNIPPQLLQSSFKEIRVPQPYPVYISKPVPVQVPVRVPVEVPKPYPVRVPHPVPVPVQIRVPVPVEKPYPVEITRTVPVPVEKPVYIRVPHVVTEPVPHPYPNVPPQNLLQGYQQQLLNFGEVANGGQFVPQEVQIGSRLQATPQQLQANGGAQSLGIPLSPLPNGGTSNLQPEAKNPRPNEIGVPNAKEK